MTAHGHDKQNAYSERAAPSGSPTPQHTDTDLAPNCGSHLALSAVEAKLSQRLCHFNLQLGTAAQRPSVEVHLPVHLLVLQGERHGRCWMQVRACWSRRPSLLCFCEGVVLQDQVDSSRRRATAAVASTLEKACNPTRPAARPLFVSLARSLTVIALLCIKRSQGMQATHPSPPPHTRFQLSSVSQSVKPLFRYF
jgi:hypothetical protein